LHNFIPAAAIYPPDVLATLRWLQESGVTALVGNDFIPAMERIPVPAAAAASSPQSKMPSSVPSGRAALPETRTAWAEDIAACADLAALQAYAAAYKGLGLCLTATQAVAGKGRDEMPAIMIIAEAPDAIEDQNGQAFTGPAHHMLQNAVFHAFGGQFGGKADHVYFTYFSKWRPPGQRSLSPPELELSLALLQREIALVRPQHIITLSETVLRNVSKGLESCEKVEKLTNEIGSVSPNQNIYNIVFKDKNNKNDIKNWLLSLQKPETMVRDSANKKRVWLSLLSFSRVLTR
jgi:uracil-DNA glycosylase family 4